MTDTFALTVPDFLAAFGAPHEDADLIRDEVARHDFRYRRLPQDERDAVMLSVLSRLDSFTQVGEHRLDIWSMAWGDVARRYDDSGGDPAALEPSFIGGGDYVRLLGDFAKPLAKGFEFNYFRVLRQWLFRRFLREAAQVNEFGCGSGFNLVALAAEFPDKRLVGLDWAPSAVDLLGRVAEVHRLPIAARRFDFFAPDDGVILGPGSAALTFCALEQTGDRCGPFIDWLLERRPDLVISMEPVLDFYDPALLFDHLVARYHTHRRYLSGYYGRLKELEAAGRIELVAARRLGMGSLYHEGYSLLIWKPL
jgi:hypothetical protein